MIAFGIVIAVSLGVALAVMIRDRGRGDGVADEPSGPVPSEAIVCRQELRVVTASSFAPVLTALAADLAQVRTAPS